MNSKAVPPPAGTRFALAMIADQDHASKVEGGWESKLAIGALIYNGANGEASYSIELSDEHTVVTKHGDKSGRGAEYSALEVFGGELLTFDDRTGNVDRLVPAGGGFDLERLEGNDGEGGVAPLVLRMGDGSKDKPLKCEWATAKSGKLVVGSTGKERTDDDGNVVHCGEMWLKVLEPGTWKVTHVDATAAYAGLRAPAAANCPHGAGYMIHESARWSDVHARWFFLPRKLSRQPYDEVVDARKCVNLMLASAEPIAPDGSGVLLAPYLGFLELRGCSDFLFVPGTRDCHLFVLRTEESLDGLISTYASVIDLEANVLMAETRVGAERKFEGAAWVGGFGGFDGPGQSTSEAGGGGECVVS